MMRRCAILLCVATAVASLHENVDNCRPVPSYVDVPVVMPLPVPVFFDFKKAEKPKVCSNGIKTNQCKKGTFARKCLMSCAMDAIKTKKAPVSMELFEQSYDNKYVNAAKKAGFLDGDWVAQSYQDYRRQHEYLTRTGSSEYGPAYMYNGAYGASSYEPNNYGYNYGSAPAGSQEYADCEYPYEVQVQRPVYKPYYYPAHLQDTDKKMCKKQATEPACGESMSDVAMACGRSCFKFLRKVEFYKLAGFCSTKKREIKCNKPADEQKLIDAYFKISMVPAAQCQDRDDNCESWAAAGECQANPWMSENCPQSCSLCVQA